MKDTDRRGPLYDRDGDGLSRRGRLRGQGIDPDQFVVFVPPEAQKWHNELQTRQSVAAE